MPKADRRHIAAPIRVSGLQRFSRQYLIDPLETRTLFSIGPLAVPVPTVTSSGLNRTVNYSVNDPVRGITVSGSSPTYTGSSLASYGVTGLVSADGIVAWRYFENYSNSNDGTNNAAIGYAIYDAIAGVWKSGAKVYADNTNPNGKQNSASNPSIQDGVVSWNAAFKTNNAADGGYVELDWVIYDPAVSVWKAQTQVGTYVGTSGFAFNYITAVSDGMVGWSQTNYAPYDFNRIDKYTVGWSIYDPIDHAWKGGTESYSKPAQVGSNYYTFTSPTISGQSVNYATSYRDSSGATISSVAHTKGFNALTNAWYEGPTKPYSSNLVSPTSGLTGFSSWYFDQSLGGDSCSWNFGDGTPASTSRSGYHTFATRGSRTMTQTVTGPGGTDSDSTSIFVDGINTTTTLVSSDTTTSYGQAVTFTATLNKSAATGTVQFVIDGVNAGAPVAVASATATYQISTLVTGAHTVVAKYSGDTLYDNSTSASLTQTISKTTPTITWATPAAFNYGTALAASHLNATGSVAGTITYSSPIGTVLHAGSTQVTATLTPTNAANYNTVSKVVTVTVNKVNLAVTPGNKSRAYGAANPTLSYSYSGFVNGDTPSDIDGLAALSTTAVAASAPGTFPITAALGTLSSSDYIFILNSGTLTVSKASVVTAVTSNNASPLAGTAITFQAVVIPNTGSNPGGTVQFQIDGSNVGSPVTLSATAGTYTVSGLTAGGHTVVAVYSGDTNYTGGPSAPFTQNVSPTPSWLATPPAGTTYTLNNNTLSITAGTLTLTADAATTNPSLSITVANNAVIDIKSTQHLGALTLSSTAIVNVVAGGTKLLRVTGLSVGSSAKLDLNDNNLVFDYAVADATKELAVNELVGAGYAGGAWTGNRLTSTSARNRTDHTRTLGVMGSIAYKLANATSTFAGEALDDTAVVVKYTLGGDSNLSGTVNFDDLVIIAQQYNKTGNYFALGNLNYSAGGEVNFDDLVILAQQYNQSLTSAVLAVPAKSEVKTKSTAPAARLSELA